MGSAKQSTRWRDALGRSAAGSQRRLNHVGERVGEGSGQFLDRAEWMGARSIYMQPGCCRYALPCGLEDS